MTAQPIDEFLTVQEIAKQIKVSTMTARRLFQDYPGVLRLESPRLTRKGRPHVTLRIPTAVFERFKQERSTGFRLEVQGVRRVV